MAVSAVHYCIILLYHIVVLVKYTSSEILIDFHIIL